MQSYKEFWLFYLSQHQNPICRWLHFLGTTSALGIICTSYWLSQPWYSLIALFVGYGFSWIGHFFFEKNMPATFRFPIWSLRAELQMYFLMWRGRL